MKKLRTIEITVGILFILAAALKGLDLNSFAIQIRYYGVLPTFALIRLAAIASIIVETILGAMLIGGIRLRGITYGATILTLVVFSGLVLYAWSFHDLQDCGCFGKVLPLGPKETLAKNVLLIGFLAYAWKTASANNYFNLKTTSEKEELVSSFIALLGMITVGTTVVLSNNANFFRAIPIDQKRPFSQLGFTTQDGETIDLNNGKFLVAMLSATCEDCAAAVAPLNEIHAEALLPVIGFVFGEPDQFQTFIDKTQPLFPLHRVEANTFFTLISSTAPPPRFYVIENGQPLRYWDTLHANTEALKRFCLGEEPYEQ